MNERFFPERVVPDSFHKSLIFERFRNYMPIQSLKYFTNVLSIV